MKRGEFASIKRQSVDKAAEKCYSVLDIGLPGRFFTARKSLAEFRHRSAEIKSNLFFPATCAWEKTLHAPPVCPQGTRRGVQIFLKRRLACLCKNIKKVTLDRPHRSRVTVNSYYLTSLVTSLSADSIRIDEFFLFM